MDLAGIDVFWPLDGHLDEEVTQLVMSLRGHSLPMNNLEVIYDIEGRQNRSYASSQNLSHTLLHNLARCYGHDQRSVVQVPDREPTTAKCR